MTVDSAAPDALIMPLKDEWYEQALSLNEMGRGFYTPLSQMYVRNCNNVVFGRVDGHVVGVLFYHISGSGEDKTFCVGIISVNPLNHRQGVGKAMLDCAYQEALHSGANAMQIEVKASNAPSLGLLEKCGFQKNEEDNGILTLSRVVK